MRCGGKGHVVIFGGTTMLRLLPPPSDHGVVGKGREGGAQYGIYGNILRAVVSMVTLYSQTP